MSRWVLLGPLLAVAVLVGAGTAAVLAHWVGQEARWGLLRRRARGIGRTPRQR